MHVLALELDALQPDLAAPRLVFQRGGPSGPEDAVTMLLPGPIQRSKPWRAETNKLDFKEGCSWQYDMIGPNNERQHGKFQYTKINAPKSFEGTDSFTDEKGFVNSELPQAYWKNEFRSSGAGTDVKVTTVSLLSELQMDQ